MTTFYSGYTNVANATTPAAPPTAPTLLIATAVSAHQIDLTWTAGTGQDGYIVERSLDGATGWTAVGSSATTAFSDKGLLSGTTYYYRVYGYNGSGISGYSNVANATTFLVIPVIRHSRALGSGGIGFRSEGLAYLFDCFSQNLTTDLQVDAYSTAYANGNAIPVTVVNGTLTPLKGDRAVRDTTNYPVLHASDIEVNAYTYHTNPANPPITGEPGTLAVDTTNQIGPPHTHAITTSANPGVASAILKSDVNGKLTLVGLTLSDNAPTLLLNDTGGDVYQVVNSSSVVEHSVVGGGTFISYDDVTGNLTLSARTAAGGVFFKTGGANHLWAVLAGDVYVDKIFYAKQAVAAGIALDHNSATGNYTLSLSPANLTGNRRHTFPNYNVVWPATDSAGHLASDGAGNLSWTAAVTGADPTASVGLTAVNGVATTFMRSDAAPPIDQGIIPTWTGVHTFSNTTDSGSSSTGAIVTSGGIGVAKSVFIDGSLYIGATAGSAGMYINKIFADSGGVVYGEWISMFAHSLSASSAAYYGGMHEAYVRSGNISNYTGSIVGMSSIVKHEGSGTVSLAVSALIAGTTNTGGGTITTNVGLDVQAQTAGATNYAIRTSTGQVSIGDTTDSTSTATGAVVIAGGVGIAKNLSVGAHVGVMGTAPASNVGLYCNAALTDTSGSFYAVYSRFDSNPAGASSASIFGYAGIATVTSGNAQTHTGTLYGVLGQATHQGSGTLTAEIGIRSATNSTGGGTVVSAFGVQALGPTITGAGSAITTIYGVYIGTQKVTGVTTAYGIYQAGASDVNYFAGTMGVGGAVEAGYQFQVAASVSAGNVLSSVRNSAAANVANTVIYDMRLETSVQTRTAFVLSASFSTTTDASRTSTVLFRAADAGTFSTVMTFVGKAVTFSGDVGLTTKITTYNNVATEGYGVGAIVDDVALTNQGADIGSTNFTNAGTAGTYLVTWYIYTTTLDAAAGTVTLSVSFSDGTTTRTRSSGAVDLTSTSSATSVQASTVFVRLGSGSISYSVAHTGNYGNAKYALYMSCIRLS